jgi:hypothetical protein
MDEKRRYLHHLYLQSCPLSLCPLQKGEGALLRRVRLGETRVRVFFYAAIDDLLE